MKTISSKLSMTTLALGLIFVAQSALASVNSFTAEASENFVTKIEWQVVGESGMAMYLIERAIGDDGFAVVGQTHSLNNMAGVQDYHWSDNVPGPGDYTYRLRMVDNEGQFEYSEEITTTHGQGQVVEVWPNPSNGWFNLMSNENIEKITVFDYSGRSVLTQTIGARQTKVEWGVLPAGTYILEAEGKFGNKIQTSVCNR